MRLMMAAAVITAAATAGGALTPWIARAGASDTQTPTPRSSVAVPNEGTGGAWSVSSGIYLAADTNSHYYNHAPQTLYRFDVKTKQVEAALPLAGVVDDVIDAGNQLVVTTTRPTGPHTALSFVRTVNPHTLAPLHVHQLPDGSYNLNQVDADGTAWIADNSALVGFDPTAATITKTVRASTTNGPGSQFTAVATDRLHQSLIDSVQTVSDAPVIQRRDPVSASLQAQSPTIPAAFLDNITVIDNGIWYANPTGLFGYIGRLSLTTLQPTTAMIDPNSINDIAVNAYGGVLYITNAGGNPAQPHNYCADPLTGTARAALPALKHAQLIGGAAARYDYLTFGPSPRIGSAAVPAAC